MTPEERSLLQETHRLAEENNSILRGIRRSNTISMVMRIAYWVLIIGLSVGAYYVIQPYINLLSSVYGTNINNVQSAAQNLQDLFK